MLFALGLGVVYGSCAGLFLVASLICLGVRYEHVPPPREPVTLTSLLAGIGFIRDNPILLGAISLDLFAVLLGGATALLPIYAAEILHVGPQGLGGDSTAFAVHIELAATHITMNPVAVNMQCHSARRASARLSAAGVQWGF